MTTLPPAAPPKTCAAGPCTDARLAGSMFCAKHGPMRGRASASSGRAARPELVCPHCQVRGQVRAKQVKVKRGISGGKATGAVLTGGLSLFATGLSRKVHATQAKCGNCGMEWTV